MTNEDGRTASGRDRANESGNVLSTMNVDGSRRRIAPKLSRGTHHSRRRWVAWILILAFTAIPFVRIGGAPLLLLDVVSRRFTIFGQTFLATDGPLVAAVVVFSFLVIFLLTALVGRVWCGWGCPQTVYLEFVYRPIERFFDRLGGGRVTPGLRLVRFAVWLAISLVLANTFLAYFVGVERLATWITSSPAEHPQAFLVVAVTTALMMIDFTWFREQMCTLVCPYGRFQSVLLDRASKIIGYDARRGEPRGKFRKDEPRSTGDCIDCTLCVQTCPTGIDIREGLQMECIACAQCIDACDHVMDKIGRPRGLIRYASLDELAGRVPRLVRPRVIVYSTLLAIVLAAGIGLLVTRSGVDAVFLRARATPFRLAGDGRVDCPFTLHLASRQAREQSLEIAVAGDVELAGGDRTIVLPPFGETTIERSVLLPRSAFQDGKALLRLRLVGDGIDIELERVLVGPSGKRSSERAE
jgi:cytochrome c oxidase accessory protein FixG